MRLRFSIRDLLWLTLVVGMGVAWWLSDRSRVAERDSIIKSLSTLIRTNEESSAAVINRLDWKIESLEKQHPDQEIQR